MRSRIFTKRQQGVGHALVLCAALLSLAPHGHAGEHRAKAVPQAAKASPAQGAVQVTGGWVRATVPGQSGTGGFMTLQSPRHLTLIGFSSDVAGSAELHEMAMDGDVMRMRPISALPLPAGKPVELKPGGHHLMLMDLKQALSAGGTVQVTLRLKTDDGRLIQQPVTLPVSLAAPGQTPAAPAPHGMGGHGHGH